VPFWSVRRMYVFKLSGATSIPWVVTTKLCWVPGVVGAWPTWRRVGLVLALDGGGHLLE